MRRPSLLDANVVSETLEKRPSAEAIAWLSAADAEQLYLSAITIAELASRARKLTDPGRRRRRLCWIETDRAPRSTRKSP